MKLTINSNELEQAVANYVETLGFSLENKEVSYFLDDEANCHIDIVTGVASPVLEDKPTQKRKSRTKIEPKTKTKQDKPTEENVTSDGVEKLIWDDSTDTTDTDEEVSEDNDIPFNEDDSQDNTNEEEEEPTTKKVKDNGFSLFSS